MTDNINHTNPVDQLFRKALADFAPAPPADAWKAIDTHFGKGGNWYMRLLRNPYGLSVISAVFIGIAAWLIFRPLNSPEVNTAYQVAPKTMMVDSARYDITALHIHAMTNDTVFGAETKPGAEKAGYAPGKISRTPGISIPDNHLFKAVDMQNSISQSAKVASGIPGVKQTVPQSSLVAGTREDSVTFNDNGKKPSGLVNDSTRIVPQVPVEQFRDTTKKISYDKSSASGKPADLEGAPANDSTSHEPADSGGTSGGLNPKGKVFFNIGLSVNYGKVFQKGRNAYDWYGTDLCTGIWLPGVQGGLSTGIGLQKFKDEGSFVFEYQTIDTTGFRIDTTWYFQDSIPYFEVSNAILTDTTHHSQALTSGFSYTYLRIPLYFTKQLYSAGSFVLGLKAGPSVSILISKNEEAPVFTPPAGNLISSSNNSYQRLKTSWQLLLAPQLSYQSGGNLRIYAEPSFTWFINNLYDKKRRPVATPFGFSIYGGIEFTIR